MRISSCLFTFILGCNVTAGLIHRAVEENKPLDLACPQPVLGEVTWSRELTNGSKVDLLTTDGSTDQRHDDKQKRFSSISDIFKSLHISKVFLSDSGRYLCNSEAAEELTVIPSGTMVLDFTGTTVQLNCTNPRNQTPTWVRQTGVKNVTVFSPNTTSSLRLSAQQTALTLSDVRPSDSGLYHCEGRAAVYLNVAQSETPEGAAPKHLVWTLGLVVPLILILFLILFLTWRHRFKTKGGVEETDVVYLEIQDSFTQMSQPTESTIYSLIH